MPVFTPAPTESAHHRQQALQFRETANEFNGLAVKAGGLSETFRGALVGAYTTVAELHELLAATIDERDVARSQAESRWKDLEALRTQVSALTPRWQEGEPPDGPVWREGVAYPVRIKRHERYGLMYWDDGFEPWAAGYGESQPRWAPIPKPTEG